MDISGCVTAPQSNNEDFMLIFIISIIAVIFIALVIYAIIAFIASLSKNKTTEFSSPKAENIKLQCQICNSQSLIKENDHIVCQECGCKYSIDEAKNLIENNTTATSQVYRSCPINPAKSA